MSVQSELTIHLRNYMDADASSLTDILNSGKGLLLGHGGLFNAAAWTRFRSKMAAEQVIMAEKNLKSYLIGYVGISRHSVTARRAEITFFCIGPEASRTIPDKKALDSVLAWCFDSLGLNKVTLEVLDGNSVLGTLESAGFVSEGVRKAQYQVGQDRVDSVVLSLLASAWRSA